MDLKDILYFVLICLLLSAFLFLVFYISFKSLKSELELKSLQIKELKARIKLFNYFSNDE